MFKSQYKTALAGLLISLLFVISCTKIDTTKLGAGLIPAVDNINTFDTTINVIASNFDDLPSCDTLNRADFNALGIISDDPYFGKSNANIYVEFKPATFPVTVAEYDAGGLVVDSAIIVLQYAYSYGDTNTLQKVSVFPLSDRFKVDSSYTTCDAFQYQNILLGQKAYTPSGFKDSVELKGGKVANQLRIPITKAFAENWLKNASTVLSSDSAFKINNKGFAFVSDQITGGRALNYFNLSNPNTGLTIYYRTSKGDKKDTTVLKLSMTNTSGEANFIERIRGNSEITKNLSQPLSGNKDIYIQASPGNFAELKIPGLSNLSNRVIHRAELIMEEVYSANTFNNIYKAPQMLYIDTKDTSTLNRYIPVPCDFNQEAIQSNFATLGGIGKKISDADGNMVNQYVFNISRYVQTIVTKNSNNAVFRLRAPYYIHNYSAYVDRCRQLIAPFNYGMNSIGDGRLKLHGTDGSPARIKLHIVYSKL